LNNLFKRAADQEISVAWLHFRNCAASFNTCLY